MITVSYFELIDIIIIVNSILFIIFLITVKTKNHLSNILFSVYIFIQALDTAAGFVSRYLYPAYPGYALLVSNLFFLLYPALFLYVLSVLYSDFKLKRIHLIHLTPYFLSNLIMVPRLFLASREEKLELLLGNTYINLIEIKILYLLITIFILIYLGLIFYHILRCRNLIKENYSNDANHSYKWVLQFILFYSLTVLIGITKNLFMYAGLNTAYNIIMQIIPICIFVYICWIVFKALQTPDLFRGIESNLQLVKSFSLNKNKDRSHQEENPKIRELEDFMEKEEPFLDPSLTVFELSNQMGWSSRELSLLINNDLGQHFFDFVNSYRVNKAKMYLENYNAAQYNISEILYKVGFNSKSSFNTAFKKHAKLTPSQFRKSHSA